MKAHELAEIIDRHVSARLDPVLLEVQKRFDQDNQLIESLKSAVEALPAAILAEVPAPEQGESGKPGEKGDPGESVTVDDVMPELKAELHKAIEAIPEPQDGRDGKDGQNVTIDDVRPLVESEAAKWALDFERRAQGILQNAIDRIPASVEAREFEVSDELIGKSVTAYFAENPTPAPKDGKDGLDGADGRDGVDGKDGEPGKNGEPGLDGADGADATDEQVAKAVTDYLTDNPPPKGDPGKDGRDGIHGKDGLDGADGTSVTKDDVLPELHAELQKAIDAIPQPRDGKDGESVAVDDVLPVLEERIQKAIEAIPTPKDGKDGASVTLEDVLPDLQKQVQDAIEALPVPTSVTIDDVFPQLQEQVQKAIEDMPVPEDGKDGTSVTLDDIRPLIESKTSEWALDFEKRGQDVLQKIADRMPAPKDGRDAFDLEDFDLALAEDGRTLTVALTRGDERIERSIKGQWPIYRGVWQKEQQYDAGDCVTWDGSTWTAMKASKGSKPGQFNSAWKLSVKKGRNGKSS